MTEQIDTTTKAPKKVPMQDLAISEEAEEGGEIEFCDAQQEAKMARAEAQREREQD